MALLGLFGIEKFFGEIELAHANGSDISQPGQRGRGKRQGRDCESRARLRRIVCGGDRGKHAIRIVLASQSGVHGARHQKPGNARGRTGDDEFDAAAGRDADVILPADKVSRGAVGIYGNTVEGDYAELLRRVPVEDCEIEIGDR